MANELATVQDMKTMAKAIVASGFAGCKNEDQALTLMLIAQAEGRHPGIIARDYHVINGRPSLKADTMLARFQEQGGTVRWNCLTNERAEAVFSHKRGGELTIDWDIQRAKQAGVYDSNPNWKKYPRAQLRSRCITEGIRSILPGVLCGVYTPEEIADMDTGPRTPDYSIHDSQPTANATPKEAVDAIKNAPAGSDKGEATEEHREQFVNYLQTAFAAIGDAVREVVECHGYNSIDEVHPKDFRPIMRAVKELMPKK